MLERFGRYRLLQRLGGGGMGEVFLAQTDTTLPGGPLVVVKRMRPGLDHPLLVRQFLEEAKASALVQHPNVAAVFELGVERGQFFLVTEYVHGLTVADLTGRGPLDVAAAALLLRDAARGLHAAHMATGGDGSRLGIAHGDVSPRNLMVSDDGVTRVIDFGLARLRRSRLGENSLGGTVEYQAPEQALEGVIDARTDLFSLGVVAWELLSGRRLFAADTDETTLDAVLACRVPRLREVAPAVPETLEALVAQMLERDPAHRLAGCGAAGDILDAWLALEQAHTAARAWLQTAVRERVDRRAPLAPASTDAPDPSPRRSLTATEAQALRLLRDLPTPLTLAAMEAALAAGPITPTAQPPLDLLEGLVEAGALVRTGDETFTLVPPDDVSP